MNYFKKRLSIFLCILVAFTTVCFAAPQETKAASNVYLEGIATYSYTKEIRVYKDSKNLYAGDFVSAYDNSVAGTYYGNLSLNSGVTYKSSKPSVASIDSKTGKINPKKNGTTEITVKFKGATAKFKLKVVSKKDLKKALSGTSYEKELSDIEDSAKIYLKSVGNVSKITTSNRYKVLTAYASYDYRYYSGCSSTYDNNSQKYIYHVYSPEAAHVYAINRALERYASERNPFTTGDSKLFKVKAISGKANTNKISATLASKVTEDQIFGANYQFSFDSKIEKSSTYRFPIKVQDTKTKYKYYAIATIKKGSDKMTIEIQNAKLKKGTTYKLISYVGGYWLLGSKNTFKVK